MRKILPVIGTPLLLSLTFVAHAQKSFPSDASLLSLVDKHLHTPVQKTTTPNGDVFLQRDVNPYLHSTVQAPDVSPAESDYGHDHKDVLLREFLNRPQPSVATLNKYFDEAAREFAVPASILKAAAQVQSNWAQVSESVYGSWGVMGLIENKYVQQISLAASLLGVNADDIKNNGRTNIRAGAALLAHYQKNKPTAVEDWFEAVKILTGLRDEAMKHSLALRIYDVIKEGSKSVTLWGEIIFLQPENVSLPKAVLEAGASPATSQRTAATVDYPLAVPAFTPCNFNSRPTGSVIKFYFVHYIATGTYQGAISWFKDCSSSVSAHYVVRNSDGEVSQVVAENDRAWSQGVTLYNDLGIGVEHEVLATNLAMWDSDPMLTGAANLCRDVCNRRSIPKVRRAANGDAGIYGHSDVRATDCPNMTDARWTAFLNRVNAASAAAPLLYSITASGSGTQLTATWKASTDSNLIGYRLYYATNDALSNWALAAAENTLTVNTISVTLDSAQFILPPSGNVYHFKLTAVVSNGTNPPVESTGSDIYSRSSNTAGPKVLIVDGFDRFGGMGSWPYSTHPFAANYFKALRNKASLQISTVANEKVEDGTFSLNNYDIVVWFVGDESSANVVFSAAEKTAIQNFLNGGGKLIVSGSEIAYNLGRTGAAAIDLPFMNNYLKAAYVADGASTYTPATGIAGTAFAGLTIPFGITYPEDFPDAVSPLNGSTAIFTYNGTTNYGGVAYKGTFGSGTVPGALIYLSYTLETAADTSMTYFMEKALGYFDVPIITMPVANDDAATTQTRSAKRIAILANDYTNGAALKPASVTIVTPPANGTVTTDTSGNVTYVSNAGFTGNNFFRYKVQNTSAQFSTVATVSVTVMAATPCNPLAPEVDDANPKRDLRGAWVSTVSNIDWPSSRTLTTAQQQAELLGILDTLARTGINTVYLQVRPESDALYASAIEPWSYWLTNAQGAAPNPLWDPLQFAVAEAHKRGMELHAWFNPYRAKQSTPALAANHVVNLHPDWTFAAGTLIMLNPGLPQVRQYLTDVIADVATRYDVDGVHFDDYFYPSSGLVKQDSAAYADYNPTGISNIDDWRRNNVNGLVAKVYDTLQAINAAAGRNIVFGVSPFGIWKSGVPAGITGQSSYSALYCDPIAWLQAGKVDYVAPQLYWKITGAQDYNALSKWWNDQGATYNRYIYPGLALYKMSDANNWAASEIEAQISLNRDQSREQVEGQILFSTKQIMTNVKGIKTSLQTGPFRYKALPPALSWKETICPNPPVNVRRDGDSLRWEAPMPAADGDRPRKYAVYRFATAAEAVANGNDATKLYAVTGATQTAVQVGSAIGYFMVTALDKNNNESEANTVIALPVSGLNLTVKLSGNTALINWTTLTEMATKQFNVERSTDGRNFTFVATVTAAGNSNTPRTYAVQDFLSAEGSYRYRIRSVDRDGRSSYSAVKTIAYKAPKVVTAAPNPFRNGININGLTGVKRLDVIDISGRVVLSKALNNEVNVYLNTQALPAGQYLLRMAKTDTIESFIKLMKL